MPMNKMKRPSICTLGEALDYYNSDIIDRFLGIYQIPPAEAEQIFHETKKWIWLLAAASQDRRMGGQVPRLVIDNFLIFIDEMWHNFILFTKLYHEYCLSKFGFFIHHNPTPKRIKDEMNAEFESSNSISKILEIRKEQYSYIYDKLGADTLELWYGMMSDQYTHKYFNQIRK
jgi:hypothetical protein